MKAFLAVDCETHTLERNTELAVRLAGENTLRSLITDVRARVATSMDGLCTGVEAIFVRTGTRWTICG